MLVSTTNTTISSFQSVTNCYRGNTGINNILEYILDVQTLPFYFIIAQNTNSGGNVDGGYMNIVQIPESTNLVQNSTIVSAINAASDANIVSPSQSQVLSWNNTILKWENTSITTNDANFAKLTRINNNYENYTNSVSDGGAFNVFSLFTSNASSTFTNSGFTAVNSRKLVYTGTTSRIF